jgi:curved DNA-binding protein CbpA
VASIDSRIDYYDVLGVAPDADPEVVRAAYRALAKKYHPDSRLEGKAEAEKKLREVNQAYEVLSSPVDREKYDRQRSARHQNSDSGDSNRVEETLHTKDESHWRIIEQRHPEIQFKYKQLLKISRPLAEAFRSRIIRERAFTKYDQISSELIDQFSSRYFGTNQTLRQFGLWCLFTDKREAARELNQIIAKLGTPQDPSQILAQLRAKHRIAAPHGNATRQGAMKPAQIPRGLKLALMTLGGIAIAVLALSGIVG